MLFALLSLACKLPESPPLDAEQEALVEECLDGLDNDSDGWIDCQDSDCFGPSCEEDCSDRLDNDADGATDCQDPDCALVLSCREDCSDGVDNDSDGATDCADQDCEQAFACQEQCDGQDRDQDGLRDCEDADCWGPGCAEDCMQAGDEDGDGLEACEDPDCWTSGCEEVCDDGADNDGDGRVDCEDADCMGMGCMERHCGDGLDNNGNGFTDCEDDGCLFSESCTNEKELMIHSAALYRETRLHRRGSLSGPAAGGFQNLGALTDVVGSVRFPTKPTQTLSSATSWTTCDFAVDSIPFGYTTSWATRELGGARALGLSMISGVQVDPPCEGMHPSLFLPDANRLVYQSLSTASFIAGPKLGALTPYSIGGRPWLIGSELVFSTTSSFYTTYNGLGYTARWSQAQVFSGSVYALEPILWRPTVNY